MASAPHGVDTDDDGVCTFRQDCFQTGVDTACTARTYAANESATPFPMDAAHGFGVPHNVVWDGSYVDPDTGLCASGTPDEVGRCQIPFETPKGLSPVAPLMCPKFQDAGCCTWQANWSLYRNLGTLVQTFGSSTGCLACAVNLVRFWCALVCSPRQGHFATVHDPPRAVRRDDLTGADTEVLQGDIMVDAGLVCAIYESCRGTAIVGEATAMQSALGLLKFQMQTGAVGHGQYFFLSTTNASDADANGGGGDDDGGGVSRSLCDGSGCGDRTGEVAAGCKGFRREERTAMRLAAPEMGHQPSTAAMAITATARKGDELDVTVALEGSAVTAAAVTAATAALGGGKEALTEEALACDSFWDPGAVTPPFLYPPPRERRIGCGCEYCPAACAAGGGPGGLDEDDLRMSVFGSFNAALVGLWYATVASACVALAWWRRQRRRGGAA